MAEDRHTHGYNLLTTRPLQALARAHPHLVFSNSLTVKAVPYACVPAFTIMSEFTRFFSSVGGKNTGIPPNESQYHHRTRLLESSTVTGWKSVSFPSCRRGAPARGQGQPVFSPRQPDIWAPTHWGRQGTRQNISQV